MKFKSITIKIPLNYVQYDILSDHFGHVGSIFHKLNVKWWPKSLFCYFWTKNYNIGDVRNIQPRIKLFEHQLTIYFLRLFK